MSDDTLGALAEPVAKLDPSLTCRQLNSLFRSDPHLRSVLVDREPGVRPALVNRAAFYQAIAGPRGYGWALYSSKRVADILPVVEEPLALPAAMTLEEAGIAVLTHDELTAGDDLLVYHDDDDGTCASIAVSEILSNLAGAYRSRVEDVSRQEQRFRTLLHAASGTVVSTDAQGRITYTSPHVVEWVGVPDETLLHGFRSPELLHPDDQGYGEAIIETLIAQPGGEIPIKFRVRRSDDRVRWMEGTARNLLDNPAVNGLVFNFRDVTERHVIEEELRRQAFHDSLTELPNRAVLRRESERMLVDARRNGHPFAAFLIDLDRFKDVNDLYGHSTGDSLLVQVSSRLKDAVGPAGLVGRLGGDEFLALVEGDGLAGGPEAVAESILSRLGQAMDVGGRRLTVSASIGVASGPRESSSDLLREADIALYRAKGSGRNRYCVFTPDMKTEIERRAWTEANLARARERNELLLHFQPGVRLSDLKVTAAETLLRWQHPERGLIYPQDFIPTLEENGQIVPVSRWVLQESCRAMAGLHAAGHRLLVSVNVSPRHFGAGSTLYEDVSDALAGSGLPPEYLCIEITESTLLRDTATIRAQLESLKQLGVSIAIDDFGVGYSSLSYLATLPIDVVKIDRSFVSRLGHSRESEAVLQAIVRLGEALSLATVGEGVEDETQLDHLRSRGCLFGQGYLFAKPMPLEEFYEYLDDYRVAPAGGLIPPAEARI